MLIRLIAAAPSASPFRGRPRKVSPSVLSALRDAGHGASDIARRLKVSRWTVYRALKRLPPAERI